MKGDSIAELGYYENDRLPETVTQFGHRNDIGENC
jgi:hypothetical protein